MALILLIFTTTATTHNIWEEFNSIINNGKLNVWQIQSNVIYSRVDKLLSSKSKEDDDETGKRKRTKTTRNNSVKCVYYCVR